MTQLVLLFLLTFGVMSYAAWNGPFAMRGVVLMMMVFVAFFAPKLVNFPWGGPSNFGNVWYACALTMQTCLARRIGWKVAMSTLGVTLYWLIVIAAVLKILSLADPIEEVGKDAATTEAIRTITANMLNIALFSWVAFFLASSTVIGLVVIVGKDFLNSSPWRKYFGVLAISCVGQVVDSIMFFPGAFWGEVHLESIMLTGLAWKCIMTLAFTSVVFIGRKPTDDERRAHAFEMLSFP